MSDLVDQLAAFCRARGATEVQIGFFSGSYSVSVWALGDQTGAYQTIIAQGHNASLKVALRDALAFLKGSV